ncbi:MAG: DMT family transporter [Cyanobacteria bacterium J06598_3]
MTRSTPRATALLGLVFVLLSALGLATQNVISRIFFVPSQLFGQLTFGGFIAPKLENVVLLLAIRMAMMALLLASVSPWLYPDTFLALCKLPKSPRLFRYVVGSSASLFIGLTCLYTALSQIEAGIAIAIFFIYPAVTVLLDWYFFRQRLPYYKLGLMAIILVGVVLTTLTDSPPSSDSNLLLGLLNAAGAGLSFGVYGILAEVCLQHQPSHRALHPVPFSLSTFVVVSGLAGLTLPFLSPIAIAPSAWTTLLALTLFSAAITLTAYVFSNFGIRYIGASLTALISASSPALTVLFAWVALQETLQIQQLLGVGLVTAGVAALSVKAS